VNGREFAVQKPDEPLCCVRNRKLVTLVVKGCGISISEWKVEEIEGHYSD
jgi:hypothetical protein